MHYNEHHDYLQYNMRLYKVLEGQVKTEVEDSLRKEILSASALNRALQRIPSLNVLKKATDKLSRVYIEQPLRLADNDTDKEILKNISNEARLDSVMTDANRIYNAQNTFAVEPYIKEGKHHFRVLAGHQFLPYSDDPTDSTNCTVFIKLMGSEFQTYMPAVDADGNKNVKNEQVREVDILWLYSDDEFLIVDSSGSIREDKMLALGQNGTNPFGKIPFIIGNKSKFELVPFPNQAGLDISVLIPKLLTDLNYASQFMSHSIIWTRNTDLSGNEINPDSVVNLGDSTAENGDPDIGTINPTVDITNTLKLIDYELTSYLSTIGIKTNFSGSDGEAGAGVSKAIDEGDITAEYKVQTEFFKRIECQLWELVQKMQSIWAADGSLTEGEPRLFSEEFIKTFRIHFKEIKTLKTHQQMLDEIKVARELKLMSRRQALRELKPELTEDQISSILEEISQEAKDDFDEMVENGMAGVTDPSVPQGRSEGGEFKESNQFGKEQAPDKNLKGRLDS
jgi:polyhydroxyalkanoate synthesis regulator phasin